ncbi:hypothetical protein PSHT_01224 [Puccinia striiformis]|uniref:SGNH hydrolase-type esterase domain-containing protein n=1 Tax=Puccinia striiformis TaxID=27350 RepID=A0A2S4WL32_9BASI|nr:hypothetical protein Pst134EB_016845 [Puccinia striiformis f. sp. tritici]KAI9606381.1 hypothetical protein KEM48_001746 [Puccinia striiformis f. sp. tritici PST-130]POW22496.1 hypothetical protein PSHT_01224 [Puccinia striiformis]
MRGLEFVAGILIMCSFVLPKAIDLSESSQYTSVVVFGASYCDNGHARDSKYSSSLREPPYFQGRWSNGPVWVEHMAEVMGIPLYNYAYGGATANNAITNSGVPDTRSQIQYYINDIESGKIQRGHGRVLHLMWVGINSVHHIWHSGEGVQKAMQEAEEVKRQFSALLNDLTVNSQPSEFHALTLPPLQIVPNDAWAGAGPTGGYGQVGIKRLTEAYNLHLIGAIRSLNSASASVHDIGRFWYRVSNAPASFGFTHVKAPCLSYSQPCQAPAQYIYFDSLHPTTRMHTLIGDWVLSMLSGVTYKN